MFSFRLWKIWKGSESLLLKARAALPEVSLDHKDEFETKDKIFREFIDHNEHELALDVLEEMGVMTKPRGGFWKDLERAAVNMGLDDRVPSLRSEFDKALLR